MDSNTFNIDKTLFLLRDHLWTIILFTLLTTSIVTVYAYFLPSIFSSSVTLSIANGQSSKLQSVIPGSMGSSGDTQKGLETLQLTLQSRKFILSALKDIDVGNRYFVNHNFKKVEVDKFRNLELNVTILDSEILNSDIEIIPKSNKSYRLKIKKINYEKEHNYGKQINNKLFKLKVKKITKLTYDSYVFTVLDKEAIVDDVLSNLETEAITNSVIKIMYSDTVPKRAKDIVEVISKHLISDTLTKKSEEIKNTSKFLNQQINEIKHTLNNEGEALKQYQEKNNMVIAAESGVSLNRKIAQKSELLKKLELKLRNAKLFKTNLKKYNKLNTVVLIESGLNIASIQTIIEQYRKEETNIEEMLFQKNDITKQMTSNTQLNTLIASVEKKQFQISQLRENFTTEHPKVLALSNAINSLTNRIYTYIDKSIYKSRAMKSRWKNKILSNISLTQKGLSRKIAMLQKEIQKDQKAFKEFPQKTLEIEDLNRKFRLSEDVYTFLLQRKMEIDMKFASTVANTSIIEDAVVPKFPIKPNKKMIIAIGFLLGLILSVTLIFLKELLNDKITDEDDVEKIINSSIYGVVPNNQNLSYFQEALKNIRTNLFLTLASKNRCQNILVSSNIAGEGKTTVSVGLASAISHADKRVILLDLDLRRPRLHQELKCKNGLGVSDILSDNIDPEKLIQNVKGNLDFLSAGSIKNNPTELLMNSKLTQLIKMLMSHYDYIIFDSAPIGTVTDTNFLLQYSDILLLIIRANYSKKRELEHFTKMVKDKNHINSMGIILNGIKLRKNGKRYDNGYSYNYTYGKH